MARSAESSQTVEVAANASLLSLGTEGALRTDACSSWTADTGATSHMTPHRHWLRAYRPCSVPIRLADKTVVYSVGVGTVDFVPTLSGRKSTSVQFTEVLHVPDLQSSLLSVLCLARHHSYSIGINAICIGLLQEWHGAL